jgi:hypothetical protein
MEVWKPIVGYEGKYEVSSTGKIKSLNYHRSGKPKVLSPKINKYGYLCVLLYNKGKRKDATIHRLVAMSFINNPKGLPQINHKNECKQDNRVENLEWCTNIYNANYGTRNVRAINNRHTGKVRKNVLQMKDGIVVGKYISIMEASRQTGIPFRSISRVARGERKRTHGYEWTFI